MNRALSFIIAVLVAVTCVAADFPWQEPQATVTETGALLWKPKPFVDDLREQNLRYIDYENGDDEEDGKTPQTAWKHHPWDFDAAGNAKSCSGSITYVFKRGVLYRGQLHSTQSGTPEQPIRLTSTKDWGEGEAIFAGSRQLDGGWVKATTVKHPERLADPGKVWAFNLRKTDWWNKGKPGFKSSLVQYRKNNRPKLKPPFIGLYAIGKDGRTIRNHLARNPNWQEPGEDYAHDYWPAWDGDATAWNRGLQWGAHDEELKGFPQDYFTGAIIWTTWPSLMGGATPLPHRPALRFQQRHPLYDREPTAVPGHGV